MVDSHCPPEGAGGGASPHWAGGERVQTGKQLGQGFSARKWQSWEENSELQTPRHESGGPSGAGFLRIKRGSQDPLEGEQGLSDPAVSQV